MESETISLNFRYSVILKFICPCTLSGYLFTHDFMTSYIGHLEIIGSLSYTTLPNVNKFNCTVVNISSTRLIRWVCLRVGKLTSSLWWTQAFKILIFTLNLNNHSLSFILWNKNGVPWKKYAGSAFYSKSNHTNVLPWDNPCISIGTLAFEYFPFYSKE